MDRDRRHDRLTFDAPKIRRVPAAQRRFGKLLTGTSSAASVGWPIPRQRAWSSIHGKRQGVYRYRAIRNVVSTSHRYKLTATLRHPSVLNVEKTAGSLPTRPPISRQL